MKKTLVLLCFVFMSVLVFAQAKYVVCYENVKVHTTTELNGPVSGELQKNDTVNVLSTSNEWAVIDYKGSVGYVLKYFLKFVKEEKVAAEPVPEEKPVVVRDTLKDTVCVVEKVDSSAIIKTAYSKMSNAKSFCGFAANYSLLEANDNAVDGFPSQMHGISAGFIEHAAIYKNIIIVSGLYYQFETTKLNRREMNETWYYHSIKVPLKLGLSVPFAKKSSLSVYFGPSFDFNISTTRNITNNSNYQTKIDYVSGKYSNAIGDNSNSGTRQEYKVMNFFDIPVGIGAIYKYGHIGFKFEYEWGMLNRYGKNYKDEYSLKINQLSAGLIVTF